MPAEYFNSRSIGGSDAGAIIGVNKYRTPQEVWDRIQGLSDESYDSPAMERGRVLEPFVATRYAEVTRRTVEECEMLNHGEHPFLHARPDRVITGGLRVAMDGPGILEIKVLGMYTYRETKDTGIDQSYYAQLQHYMFVTGFKWGSFAIFNADAWELHWFDVERDDAFIAHMVDACVRFWNEYVETGIRPPSAIVEQIWPRANVGGEAVIHDEAEWVQAMKNLKAAKDASLLAKRGEQLAEEAIQALMGETEVVIVPEIGKVSWKPGNRTSLDRDALERAHPEIEWAKFEKKSPTRPFRPTFKN